jgi:hypothetical protein
MQLGTKRDLLLACLLIGAALAMPSSALALPETEIVTSSGDSAGDSVCDTGCTLREAIHDANDGDTDDDRINIDLPALSNTIVLGNQLPIITGPTVISNVGTFGATISGNNATNAIMIGAFDAGTDVTLSDLTITGANSAASAIVSNSADLTISGSRIVGNRATNGVGGGILLGSGSMVLDNSTVADNQTIGGPDRHGGGIYGGGATNMVISRSTISGNHTENGRGGGIFTQGGLTLQSSTVSGNYTMGGQQHGGGIASQFATGGPTHLVNSTIARNDALGAATRGGGVHSEGNAVNPTLRNTIVADNTVGTFGGSIRDDLDAVDDTFQLAFSLVEGDAFPTPTAETVPGSNLIGIDPQLGPLAQNGGFGTTLLPAPSSPVVDRGSSIASLDQRLSQRRVQIPHVPDAAAPGADGADIGSVELTFAEGPPVPLVPQTNPGSPKRCKKKNKKGAKKRAAVAKKRRGCKKKKKKKKKKETK